VVWPEIEKPTGRTSHINCPGFCLFLSFQLLRLASSRIQSVVSHGFRSGRASWGNKTAMRKKAHIYFGKGE